MSTRPSRVPDEPDPARRPLDTLEWAALAILAISLPVRISNIALLPALQDYDGAGHALNIVALYDGRLPEPTSWSGFHAPLYHAFCALLLRIVPTALPAYILFRWVSLLATALALLVVYRVLERACGRRSALIAVAVTACTPLVLVASTMLGNETTCMLFVSAALASVSVPAGASPLRQALRSGLSAGLAALSKATGLLVVPVVALWLLPGRRPARPGSFLPALAALAAAALVTAPYYGLQMARSSSSPLAIVTGAALSPDAAEEMALQPPGVRSLSDYLRFPLATFRNPTVEDPTLLRSVPGLLFASSFADAQGQYLPSRPKVGVRVGAITAVIGLLPSAIALAGLVAILRRPRSFAFALPGLGLFALLGLAFLWYVWQVPRYSAVKGSYLLPALLPASALLAVGLRTLPGGLRAAVDAALLLGALLTALAFWLGWWL